MLGAGKQELQVDIGGQEAGSSRWMLGAGGQELQVDSGGGGTGVPGGQWGLGGWPGCFLISGPRV